MQRTEVSTYLASPQDGWGLVGLGQVWLGQSASSHESNKTWLLIEVWAQICSMHVQSEMTAKETGAKGSASHRQAEAQDSKWKQQGLLKPSFRIGTSSLLFQSIG